MQDGNIKTNTGKRKYGYNTVRIRLNLVVNSANEARVNVANKIKEQLESLGIQVNIISAKDKNYTNYVQKKNYDILLTGVTVRIKSKLK